MNAAIETIEGFAVLSAALGDRFASRMEVLSAAGLDEAGWVCLQDKWRARISSGNEPDLARRFSANYRRAQARTTAPGTEQTMDMPPCPPVSPLPFKLIEGPSPYAERTYGSIGEALQAKTNPVEDPTLPRLLVREETAALPFRAAATRRLHRFDPQTGLPLPAPVWVDFPPKPSAKP